MTLTLFSKTRHRGRSATIHRNFKNLSDTKADKPSSLKMNGRRDAALLFKKDDWKGGVYYVRGHADIPHLGSAKQGGRPTFGNSVRSIRITPFFVDLNVTIVLNGVGEVPMGLKDEASARQWVKACVEDANRWLSDQRALLKFNISRITCPRSLDFFTPNAHAPIPSKWKVKGEIDVVICHSFNQTGALGIAKFPFLGRHIKVAAVATGKSQRNEPVSQDLMTETLLHEIGHYLGLQHITAMGVDNNIMARQAIANSTFEDRNFTAAQIQELHQKLVRNVTRRRDRI